MIFEVLNRPMEIGDRIRSARKARGITQAQLAAELGIDQSAVAQWEAPNSRKGITVSNLMRVADILHVTVSTLTGEEAVVTDEQETEMLGLFRQLPARQKDVSLQLFYAWVGGPEPAKLQSNPPDRQRIAG